MRFRTVPGTISRMSWKEPSERHSDDLIAAIERAARITSHALVEGFKLVALQIAAAQGTDNSKTIEASAQNIRNLIDKLHKSLPPN